MHNFFFAQQFNLDISDTELKLETNILEASIGCTVTKNKGRGL